MPKKLLEDLIKVKTREKTEQKTGVRNKIKNETREIFSQKEIWQNDTPLKIKRNRFKYAIWFVALFSVIFLFFTISSLNSRATVMVNPKVKDIALNENLSAVRDSGSTLLPFDLVVISGEENKSITADSEKDVSQKATGIVNIYNSFSSSSQVLSINTKLEGSNGKIYKTQDRVIVPGKSKTGTPGLVEAKIYADLAGVEYNSAPIDFKIANFKGTSKYSEFYARSQGKISGGLNGKYYVLSSVEKENAVKDLTSILQEKLIKKATDQIPSGFILFKDASFLNITDDGGASAISLASKGDKLVPVKVTGTLSGILFNEKKLTEKIALATLDQYDGSEIHIPNIRDLIFSMPASASSLLSSDVKSINFNLSGPIKIVWNVDPVLFMKDILGKSKKDFNQILSTYPNIDSAQFTISPFWEMSLPDKEKNIEVIINEPK